MEPDMPPMHVMQYISNVIRENYEIKYGENLLNLYNEGHYREFIELTFLSCSTYRNILEKYMPPWLIRKLYIKYSDHFVGERRQFNLRPGSGIGHNYAYDPRPRPSVPNPFCSGLTYIPPTNYSTPAAQASMSPFQHLEAQNLLDAQRSWSYSGEECSTTSEDLDSEISCMAASSSRVSSTTTHRRQQDTRYVVAELVNSMIGAIVKCADTDEMVIREVLDTLVDRVCTHDLSGRPTSSVSSGYRGIVSVDCENYSTSTVNSESMTSPPVSVKCENDISISSSTCSSGSGSETSIYYPSNGAYHSNDEPGADPNFECIDLEDQPLPTSLVPNYAVGIEFTKSTSIASTLNADIQARLEEEGEFKTRPKATLVGGGETAMSSQLFPWRAGQIAASQGEYMGKISGSPPPLHRLLPQPEPPGPRNFCYTDGFYSPPDRTNFSQVPLRGPSEGGRELLLRYEPFQPNAPPIALKPSKLRLQAGKDFTTLDVPEPKPFKLKLESSLPCNLLPDEPLRAQNLPENGAHIFGQSNLGSNDAPLSFYGLAARGVVISSTLTTPFSHNLTTTLSPVTYVFPSGTSKHHPTKPGAGGDGFKLWTGGRGIKRKRESSCSFAESRSHVVLNAKTPLKRSYDLRGGMSGSGLPSLIHQLTAPQSSCPFSLPSAIPKTALTRHVAPRSSSLRWKRRSLLFLDSLYIIPGVDVFYSPINPTHIPGYRDAVRYPMDYTTLLKRVRSGLVWEDGQLFHQITLIHMNAMMFHSEDHSIYQANKRVWEKVNTRIKNYLLTLLNASNLDDDEDE